MALYIAYTGKTSPPYQKTFTDKSTGQPLNLTGLTNANFTTYAIDATTGITTQLDGTWSIVNAATGTAAYQWLNIDLLHPATLSLWVSIQMPTEIGKREFDPDTIVILPTPEYLLGVLMATQPVNIVDSSGNALAANTAIPVEVASTLSNVILNVLLTIGGNAISGTNPVPENIVQVGGSSLALGQGTKAASLPVTLASDQGTLGVSGTVTANAGTGNFQANIAQVGGTAVSISNPLNVTALAQSGTVALYGSNPSTTGITTDVAVKWGASGTTSVNHVLIANNTSININYEIDAVTTAGSDVLQPGQKLLFDGQIFAVHLQAASSQNINGSTSGNIVVRGWL